MASSYELLDTYFDDSIDADYGQLLTILHFCVTICDYSLVTIFLDFYYTCIFKLKASIHNETVMEQSYCV